VEQPINWVAHCHCTFCQQSHGAAFVTWVSVPAAGATIQSPQGVLRWYAASTLSQTGFCSRCGSSLFFRSTLWPGELHVARANFLDPIDRRPVAHGFYDSCVDWFEVKDDLPKVPAPGRMRLVSHGLMASTPSGHRGERRRPTKRHPSTNQPTRTRRTPGGKP
jgi:hypothetical protein